MSTKLLTVPDPRPKYLIDCILPTEEIHLLAGPTGAGKTRWLFDTMLTWQRGEPILGYKSHPVPWLYVASDRSQAGSDRTMESMGLSRSQIPTMPAWDEGMSLNQIVARGQEMKAKLLVIEMFGGFVDPPSHSHQVRAFMQATCRMLQQTHMTIIGVMESPKMKPNDMYANPRQRISGVATWGHHAETIFLVEFTDPKNPNDMRRDLTMCPRCAPGNVWECRMEKEHLVVPKKPRKSSLSDLA